MAQGVWGPGTTVQLSPKILGLNARIFRTVLGSSGTDFQTIIGSCLLFFHVVATR